MMASDDMRGETSWQPDEQLVEQVYKLVRADTATRLVEVMGEFDLSEAQARATLAVVRKRIERDWDTWLATGG